MRSRSAARGKVARILLLLLLVAAPALAQQQVLFTDDFEHGVAGTWQLDLSWNVVAEGTNHVLSGSGHSWAQLIKGEQLGDIRSFAFRFKLLSGNVHVNYRVSATRTSRYLVQLKSGALSLARMTPKEGAPGQVEAVELARSAAPVRLGAWQALEITGSGRQLAVSLDGAPVLSCTDEGSPIVGGGVAFETLDGAQLAVDDVVLKGLPPSGPAWVATGGPRGGIGYDIRFHPRDPNVLWVTDANAGAHQSTDGGRTWTPRNGGITARTGFSGDSIPIFSLTIDGNDPETIWAGTQGMRGVFRTSDGGAHWVEMDNGITSQPSMEMRAFTVDPKDSNVVYCGGNYLAEPATGRQRGFIYKSTDRGRTWTLLHEPGALVRWILVDPTNTDVVYASTGILDRFALKPEGVLKSTDAGRTWKNVNEGLTNLVVGALAMHPADPKILLAGTGKWSTFEDVPGESKGALFKSTDGGAHWRKVYPTYEGAGKVYSAVAFAPSNPSIVYADTGGFVVRSSDGGETWTFLPAQVEGENRGGPIALAIHPDDPDTVFMNAYGGGVFVTRDGAKTWQDSSRGVTGAAAWALAVGPEEPFDVVAGSKNGVYVSPDEGGRWLGRNNGGINEVTAVAVDPTSPSTWLAGRLIDARILRTTDQGATWQTVLPPLGQETSLTGRRSIHRIVYAPSSPSNVYAATGIAPSYVPHDTPGPGVYRSVDGGLTWAPCNGGLEGTTLNALALAVHPRDAAIVYVGLIDKGVYRSVDGGTSWTPSNAGISVAEVRSLAIDPRDPNVVYAGLERGGFWRSLDAGATWRQASVGMPAEASIRAIAVAGTLPGVVFAGDYQSGVYRSSDGGSTWSIVSLGLTNRAVDALALTPDGRRLFAGTDGAGVFRLDLAKSYAAGLADPVDERPSRIRP